MENEIVYISVRKDELDRLLADLKALEIVDEKVGSLVDAITEFFFGELNMTERFMFAYSDAGLVHSLEQTLTLRKFGFRTFMRLQRIGIFTLIVVHAIPRPRPTRKERCAI